MARQHVATLSHYHTKSGDSLELLYPGEMSAEVKKRVFLTGLYISLPPHPSTGFMIKFPDTVGTYINEQLHNIVVYFGQLDLNARPYICVPWRYKDR